MSTAEIVFFPLKPGADAKRILNDSYPEYLKHTGFKNAYYGIMVEDPKISCFVLEWQTKDDLLAWTRNYDHEKVDKGKLALINMEAGLDPFAVFVEFGFDPCDALGAGVTELGFFSLPDKLANEKTVKEKLVSDMSSHPVMSVGKARGAATGHIFAVKPEMAVDGYTTCFGGVFGYDTVEDHYKWRETPEHGEVIKGMQKIVGEMGLKAVDVLGKRRAMVEGSGIVHVAFEKLGPA